MAGIKFYIEPKINSVVQRWCNFNVKPHPRYLECGFMVTPTDYTEEELEVRKHKVNIKDEQMARLVCYHPSTEQMVNYRMYTTPDGIVTKVEVEKKVKGKNVWMELKLLEK